MRRCCGSRQLPHRLWEPAAGRGAIVNVLRAAGHEVLASDLVDYGDPYALRAPRLPAGAQGARMAAKRIITNPPFKLAGEFVAHALDLCPRVIMLLRLAFLEIGAPHANSRKPGSRADPRFPQALADDAPPRVGGAEG